MALRIAPLSAPTRTPPTSPYLKAAAWSLVAAPLTLDVAHGGGDEPMPQHQDVLLLATREEDEAIPAAYTVTDRVDAGDLAPDHWLAPGNVWTVAASQDREPCNQQYAALIRRGDRELTTLRAWDVVEARFVDIEAATVTSWTSAGRRRGATARRHL